jgi:hypothetical protein
MAVTPSRAQSRACHLHLLAWYQFRWLTLVYEHRRRKSTAATTELIAASVAEELKRTTTTISENVPDTTRSLCFSEPPNETHQELHHNDIGVTDASRIDYLHDVSDESGSTWHHLEKSTSHSSRPGDSSQSPRSALADLGYAESAVGISKKVALY